MPLDWADYWRDTGHLSAAEHGAYLNLIGAYWVNGGPLPADPARLERLAKCSSKEWKAMSFTILAFFETRDGRISHKRIDLELERSAKLYAARKERIAKINAARDDRRARSSTTTVVHDHRDGATSDASTSRPSPQPLPQHSPNGEPLANARGARALKTRLPDDWRPDDRCVRYAQSHNLTVNEIGRVAEQFRRYWTGPDAKNPRKADWFRTWCNWIDRERPNIIRARSSSQRQSPAGIIAISREILAEVGEQPVDPDAETYQAGTGGGQTDGPSDGGQCLEADDARGMFEAAHGTENQDRAAEPDGGRREGPDGGLPSRFGFVSGRRGAPRADDVAEGVPVVAGVERTTHDAGGLQQGATSAVQAFNDSMLLNAGIPQAPREAPDRGGSPGEDEFIEEMPASLKRAG